MREVKINGIYKHFKGAFCIVIEIAKHSETQEEYVVYRKLNGSNEVWVRPLNMFLSEVDHEKYPNVEQQYRFELINLEELSK